MGSAGDFIVAGDLDLLRNSAMIFSMGHFGCHVFSFHLFDLKDVVIFSKFYEPVLKFYMVNYKMKG